MAHSKFTSIAVALICAAGVTVAAQSAGSKDEKKTDGAVTTAAKATAGGAKKLGIGVKDAVTPGSDKDKDKKTK